MAREEIVSNASEQLILVDDHDREIGYKGKADCHLGVGVLQRAFSIFFFNALIFFRSASRFSLS